MPSVGTWGLCLLCCDASLWISIPTEIYMAPPVMFLKNHWKPVQGVGQVWALPEFYLEFYSSKHSLLHISDAVLFRTRLNNKYNDQNTDLYFNAFGVCNTLQRMKYLFFFCAQCPDSACKQDLLAYLQRIALYCHQLNICSKVKAEVQNLGGELVVSGVCTCANVCFVSFLDSVLKLYFASVVKF